MKFFVSAVVRKQQGYRIYLDQGVFYTPQGLIPPRPNFRMTPPASSSDNPLIPHRGVMNVTVDVEITVSPPNVVAPPPGDAVWSVDFPENHYISCH